MNIFTLDLLVILKVTDPFAKRGYVFSAEAACLQVLSTILPSSVLLEVLMSHYKLVLGCSGQPSAQGDQWERFEFWLLACLGAVPPSVGRDESKVSEICLVCC